MEKYKEAYLKIFNALTDLISSIEKYADPENPVIMELKRIQTEAEETVIK